MGVAFLVVVCFIFIMFPFTIVNADYQGDALNAMKEKLDDPASVLATWDNTLANPCAWLHIKCDLDTTDVIEVQLGSSELAGPLVWELGNLNKLKYLVVYNNAINGSIPKELGKLTNLERLDLYDNTLTGSIPQELGNLKNLRFLRLNNNKLSGPVPDALTTLPNLQVVDMSGNPDLCGAFTDPYKPCP